MDYKEILIQIIDHMCKEEKEYWELIEKTVKDGKWDEVIFYLGNIRELLEIKQYTLHLIGKECAKQMRH